MGSGAGKSEAPLTAFDASPWAARLINKVGDNPFLVSAEGRS